LVKPMYKWRSPYKFTVVDPQKPNLVSTTPSAGAGSKEDNIQSSVDITFTFDKQIKKGAGFISIARMDPEGSAQGIQLKLDATDAQISVRNEVTMLVDPSNPIPEQYQTAISFPAGVVTSIGSWQVLLHNYTAKVTTPMNLDAAPFSGTNCGTQDSISACYTACVYASCAAFKYTNHGSNAKKCCVYASFSLGGTAGVTEEPHSTFNTPNAGDTGMPYEGIEPPPVLITSTVKMPISIDTWNENPGLETAFKIAFAELSSTPALTITTDMLSLVVTSEGNSTETDNSTSTRRLLSTGDAPSISADATITLQGNDAGTAANAVSQSLNTALGASSDGASSSSSFVAAFQAAAGSQNVTTDLSDLAVTVTAPVTEVGPSAMSFLVADSTGPSIVATSPAMGATSVAPSTHITLTFNEAIQAGTGFLRIHNVPSDREKYLDEPLFNYDVQDTSSVLIVGSTLTIIPQSFYIPGTVSVSYDAGVITDDPHEGTLYPLAGPAVTEGSYVFTVKPAVNRVLQAGRLNIGLSGGGTSTGKCAYALTGYNCPAFEECIVTVRAMGLKCDISGPASQVRKISYASQQRIADHGFAENGGDGVGTILTYGNGDAWPEYGVYDLA